MRSHVLETSAGRCHHTGSGDVQHHGLVLADDACIESLLERGYRGCRGREDVIAFLIAELQHPVHDVVIGDLEEISVGCLEHIVQASGNRIWRFPVREHLCENHLRISSGLFRSDLRQFPGAGLPRIVHQGERSILYTVDPHLVLSEPAILCKPFGIFPSCNCSCAAAYSLEICIRNPAYLLNCAEKGRAHSVTSGHILGPAFSHVARILAEFLSKGYRIVVVGSVRSRDDLDAWLEFPEEPEVVDVVVRDADDYRNVVVRADPCECPRGVSCGLDHQNPVVVFRKSRADAEGFRLFE